MPGVWKLNTAMVSVMVMGVRAGSHVHGSLCCEAAVCFACNDRAGTMHGNVSLYCEERCKEGSEGEGLSDPKPNINQSPTLPLTNAKYEPTHEPSANNII